MKLKWRYICLAGMLLLNACGQKRLSVRTKVWMRHNLHRLVKMNRFGLVQQDIWKIK